MSRLSALDIRFLVVVWARYVRTYLPTRSKP